MNTVGKGSAIVLVIAAFCVRVLAVPVSYKGDPGEALSIAQIQDAARTPGSKVSQSTRPDSSFRLTPKVSQSHHSTLTRPRVADRPLLEHSSQAVRVLPPIFTPHLFIAPVELLHPPS